MSRVGAVILATILGVLDWSEGRAQNGNPPPTISGTQTQAWTIAADDAKLTVGAIVDGQRGVCELVGVSVIPWDND